MKKIDEEGAVFEKQRAALLRELSAVTEGPIVTKVVPFLNNDVPKFLKRLARFEKESGKHPITVC
jgi:hypothetical protein